VTAETSKQLMRRITDHRFATRWFRGNGIDIGCGTDPLSQLTSFFPLMGAVKPWDIPDGDAMLMEGVADNTYDFVHSSHCLEHLRDPAVSLRNWIRICKPGGYLIISVPDEDLYEQQVWPSSFNPDHKWTFTIAKAKSWSPRSVSLFSLIGSFLDEVEVIKMELLDAGFNRDLPRQDQTRGMFAESGIEFILRKRLGGEAAIGTPSTDVQAALAQARAALQGGNPAQAEALFRIALQGNPQRYDGLVGLAETLLALGRPDEARASYEAALPHTGSPAEVYCALGMIAMDTGHTQDAVALFDKAIVADPQHSASHIQQGFARLKLGDFEQGALGLDWIYKDRGFGNQHHVLGNGTGARVDLNGRTVVISADAGLGDSVQFVRYAMLLKAQGARVVLEVQPTLVRLFAACPYIDEVVAQGALHGPFDLRVPLHNLISAFGTTLGNIPATVPYLQAPAEETARFQARLDAYPGLKVGIAWAGNPGLRTDTRRSIPVELLAPLFALGRVHFVSLQKNAPANTLPLLDWTGELTDMASTAALVQALDLVISVDTVIAHLAGALARPVWLLNRYDSCWRWLETRTDSPWYPTLLQFRQPAMGDWQAVVGAVVKTLTEGS